MAEINNSNNYPKDYLNSIQNDVFKRMDGKENGGNGDGQISLNEAYNDLNIGSLLSGLAPDSKEYSKLKSLTDNIPAALQKYAGNDGIFTANEWANFLNGSEWGQVLDTYHSSSNFAKIEMGWIDQSKNNFNDGKVTKGEVKVGIYNNLMKSNSKVDITLIDALIDKYAGEDGTFTTEEYTQLKNDPYYKNFMKQNNITPFELE